MKKYFLLIISMSLFLPVLAQEENWEEDGEIEDAQVVIEKSMTIELPQASRNFEKIPPPPVSTESKDVGYNFNSYKLDVGTTQPPVRVFSIKEEPLDKYYSNLVNAGFGNYITPYLEIFSSSKRSERYLVNLHAKHLSSRNGPVDDQNSGTSENEVGITGKLFSENLTLGGGINYDRNKYYWYGYAPQQEVNRDSIKQVYNNINLEASLGNHNQYSDLSFKAGTSFNYLTTSADASEMIFNLGLDLKYLLDEGFYASITTDLMLSQKEDLESINRTLFRVRPTFQYILEPFNLEGGFNIVHENDTLTNLDKLHFYPFVKASYTFAEELVFYGQLDGDIEANTLRSVTNENPFLKPGTPIFHTNRTMRIKGGVKGRLLDRIGYNGGFSLGNYKNMIYYANSALDSTQFDIIYDTGNSVMFNFFGEIGYSLQDRFRINLRTDFYTFDTGVAEDAWHMPRYKATASAYYNLFGKILFDADFYWMGGIKAINLQSGTERTLKDITDLSLKIDYLFSDQFSAFIDLNNMFGSNYQRFMNYPSRGFMAMVGISYSF